MPSLFKLLGYKVYFWSNEGQPLEPVHVHISKSNPSANATKFWVYSDGTVHLASNGSKLSSKEIRNLERALQAHFDEIVFQWENYFRVIAIFKDQL